MKKAAIEKMEVEGGNLPTNSVDDGNLRAGLSASIAPPENKIKKCRNITECQTLKDL